MAHEAGLGGNHTQTRSVALGDRPGMAVLRCVRCARHEARRLAAWELMKLAGWSRERLRFSQYRATANLGQKGCSGQLKVYVRPIERHGSSI
jgi:hypothetical protein